MNDLVTMSSGSLTMSSREIAELTGKEHKNVLADIRKMLNELGFTSAEFSAHMKVPMPRGGFREEQVFNLPKDLTITLVSGYNVQMRHRIVTRWQELEFKVSQPAIPQSLPEALRPPPIAHPVIHKSIGMNNCHSKQRLAVLHIFCQTRLRFS